MSWKKEDAIQVCVACEAVASQHKAHVALTGGVLYKIGERKDLDIVFYSHDSTTPDGPSYDKTAILAGLTVIGFAIGTDSGRIVKSKYCGEIVDLFFPEIQYQKASGVTSS